MSTRAKVATALEWLERRGSKRNREGMARYGIVAKKVFGVSVGDVRKLGQEIGRDHALAQALWKTEWYEAPTRHRMHGGGSRSGARAARNS